MLKLIPQGSQDAPETEALHAKVEALALAAGARRRILVANLMEEPPRVRMKAGTEQSVALAPYSVERLDWTEQ